MYEIAAYGGLGLQCIWSWVRRSCAGTAGLTVFISDAKRVSKSKYLDVVKPQGHSPFLNPRLLYSYDHKFIGISTIRLLRYFHMSRSCRAVLKYLDSSSAMAFLLG